MHWQTCLAEPPPTMRLDRLLVYLRFARSRSRADALIDEGYIRLNGVRVAHASEQVGIGDVLTIPLGDAIRIVEILSLPERRGSPALAKSYYRDLDRSGETAIAANKHDD